MPPRRDQLFKQKFDEYMGDDDDGFDDDISVGSGSRLGGLTGLRPAGRSLMGSPTGPPQKSAVMRGLGGLGRPMGGLSLKPSVASASAPAPATKLSADQDDVFKKLTLEMGKIHAENTKALKDISAFLKGLTEHMLDGFKEVSNRLNQPRDDETQESLDAMIKNIDEEIAAKDDVVYVLVPGHKTDVVTVEEATELIKSKSIKIVGSIGQLTF